MSPEQTRSAEKICASVTSQLSEPSARTLKKLPVDAHLRVLIPGLRPLGGFPDDSDRLHVDFVTGWLVADAESEARLAKSGMISNAAQLALSQLRPPPDSPGFARAMWKFLDLGYCTNRLHLTPQEALADVLQASGLWVISLHGTQARDVAIGQ